MMKRVGLGLKMHAMRAHPRGWPSATIRVYAVLGINMNLDRTPKLLASQGEVHIEASLEMIDSGMDRLGIVPQLQYYA